MLPPELLDRLRAHPRGFAAPLLAEPDGNLTIVGARARSDALELWQHRRDRRRFDRCALPWDALLEGRLARSVNAFYCEARGLAAAALPPSIVVDVPAGHRLLHAAAVDDLALVTTTSDQGYRDGELGLPFDTVQVFLLRGA